MFLDKNMHHMIASAYTVLSDRGLQGGYGGPGSCDERRACSGALAAQVDDGMTWMAEPGDRYVMA